MIDVIAANSPMDSLLASSRNREAFLQAEKEIVKVLKGYDSQKTDIVKRRPGTNCDIIVEAPKGNISIKDFCKSHYSTAPKYYAGKSFDYSLIGRGIGGKKVQYMPKVQYGFYLSLFQQNAHAAFHRAESKIMNKYENGDLGNLAVGKYAWNKGLEMLQIFKETHDIDLLSEFGSSEEANNYANARLSTYVSYKMASKQANALYDILGQEPIL